MLSICTSLHLNLVPPWKHEPKLHHSKSNTLNSCRHFHILNSFSKHDTNSSSPNQNQLGFDPSEELYGIDVGLPPRDVKSDKLEPRSWFGPNGQYIKELPCPSCRGRGYTPCAECGIERSRQDCSLCSGKGIMTCQRCLGECVIWEESIDEIPWEKARSISPFKVKEDDEVDNMELKLDARKKSKRVYRSTPPEVGLKISRSLKSLNAQTGLFSKRMKMIHRDPALHAQRVAAIKKAKGTDAARKHASETLKSFFSDPENRRKRSISMKGIRYICKNCGQEHRTYYCPELGEETDRRSKCGLCGKKGHNRRTCQNPRTSKPKQRILKEYHCRACGLVGHNRRTCSMKAELHSHNVSPNRRDSCKDSESRGYVPKHTQKCSVCGKSGHNKLTCSQYTAEKTDTSSKRKYHCQACGKDGHNRKTCSLKTEIQSDNAATKNRGSLEDSNIGKHHRQCSICGIYGHNKRTCSQRYFVKPTSDFGVSQKVREPYHCKICGVTGHNRKTCPKREQKAV